MAYYWLNRHGRFVLLLLASTPKHDRPRCGARNRKGIPYQAREGWDKAQDRPRNGRCRMHGGLSTGPLGRLRASARWGGGGCWRAVFGEKEKWIESTY